MRLANTEPVPGEIRLVDFGIAGKARPVLILYFPTDDAARALAVVLPLTSQIRGGEGEFYLGKPKFLPKKSAVNLQGIAAIDRTKIGKLYGRLPETQFRQIKACLSEFLDL